ncbi:hypothetical protein ACP4OV_004157 [Aristida adscensionis]
MATSHRLGLGRGVFPSSRHPRRAQPPPPPPSPLPHQPPSPAPRRPVGLRSLTEATNGAPTPRGVPRPRPRVPRFRPQHGAPPAAAAPPLSSPQGHRTLRTLTGRLLGFNWSLLTSCMRCSSDGVFTKGELLPYGPIELNPASAVLNYGQGLLEGLRAHRKENGTILLFRPNENALRMRIGADRLCMPAPSVEQFLEAVKLTVLANKRWVPPTGKGSLYIRPLLIGSGAILGVAPAPQYTFVVFVCPVGHYFKDGLSPISLLTEEEYHRAAPGGTGNIKTIGNYASVVSAQRRAKQKGHSDVLYLDPVHKRRKFLLVIYSWIMRTILPGITRKSVVEIAQNLGFQVEERYITTDELLGADEVFCTGTAVVLSPVGSITYRERSSGVRQESEGRSCVSATLYSTHNYPERRCAGQYGMDFAAKLAELSSHGYL